MCGVEIQLRATGDNAVWCHVGVGRVVVFFDVVDIDRVGNAGLLVHVAEIRPEVVVLVDVLHVAHEVRVVDYRDYL